MSLIPLPEPKSRQEAFDGVWARITAQGQPSVSEDGCVYRGRGGIACAVGHFVDADTAHAWDEGGYSVSRLCDKELAPAFIADDFRFWISLQQSHDNAAHDRDSGTPFVSGFHYRMRLVAHEYGLTVADEVQP